MPRGAVLRWVGVTAGRGGYWGTFGHRRMPQNGCSFGADIARAARHRFSFLANLRLGEA